MLKIRAAQVPDCEQISQLIQLLSPAFFACSDGFGAEDFTAEIQSEALSQLISRSDIEYYFAEEHDVFCGVVAIRDKTHLYHLFVKPEFQGRHIGRKLWMFAKEKILESIALGNIDKDLAITVNSSLNAVSVYERFGFKKVGSVLEKNGLAFQSMVFLIEREQ